MRWVADVRNYRQPKRYVAPTFIAFKFEDEGPFGRSAIPAQLSSSYLATQLDIIRCLKVARKVVELGELDKNAEWRDIAVLSPAFPPKNAASQNVTEPGQRHVTRP